MYNILCSTEDPSQKSPYAFNWETRRTTKSTVDKVIMIISWKIKSAAIL